MNKGKIYEFDPTILPRHMYVVKGSKKFVDDNFETKDGEEIDVDYESSKAWVIEGYHKKEERYCIIVWLGSEITAKDVAHETYHALAAFYREIGSELPLDKGDNGAEEMAAYLAGWIFDCIWKVRQGKVK